MYTYKKQRRTTSLLYNTKNRISSFSVSNKDVLSVIHSLDSEKLHGYDNVSVRMAKSCSESVTISLKIIFEESFKRNISRSLKKYNVVPVHKKGDKTLIKNYCHVSLLPIFGKIFERIICNSLFNDFLSNKLSASSQSGFISGDSFIAQLLPITHEIQTVFDNNSTINMRRVFLDISKAFAKAWRDDLIFKLKSYGVEGESIFLVKNYLQNYKQRVVLNGVISG